MDTPRRKSRKPNKYVDDIGVVGRKTGVTISGEVTKNADGLEDVEAFFAAASTNPKSNFTDKITLNTDEVDEVSMSLVTDEPSQMTPLPSKNKKPKSPIPESPILDNVDNEITNEDEVSMSLITNGSPQETPLPKNKKAKAPLKPRLPLSKNSKNTDDRVVLYKRRAAKSPTMAFNLGNLSEDNTDEENEPIQYQNESSNDNNGIRRSKRQRIKPLEFWRNERIVYGPTRTKVIRVPRPEDNGKQKKSGAGRDTKKRKRGNKKTTSNKNETDDEDIDEASSAEGLAIDWETKEKVARRVIYTLSMYQTEPIDNDGCRFQKTFSEGDFFSAGLIDIPKGRKKSGRNSNENAMVFFVFKGPVTFHLDAQMFTVKEGAQFFVPRGNTYRITNPSKRHDVRLFFAQAKE